MNRRPIRRVNPERLKKRREREFGPQAELCRESPCLVKGCKMKSIPHHVISRGAGGLDAHAVPLCLKHHEEVHRVGRYSFMYRYGVSFLDALLEMQRRVKASESSRET